MSNAVICISSSEDDDESVAKNSEVDNKGKRKLSQSLLDKNSKRKRFKIDTGRPKVDSAVVFDAIAKKLYRRISSSDSDTSNQNSKPKEPFNRQNVMVKLPEPIPGTSKSFIETEKKLSDETNKCKLDTESSLSETNKEPPVKRIKPMLVVKNRVKIPDPSDDVFSQFVEACVSHENYDDNNKEDRTILQKIKTFYNELEYSVKTSEEYRLFLNTCTQKIVNKTAKFFKTLVEVNEETKRRARTVKVTISESDLEKIKKLEDKINECKQRIEELEEEEVNFDDEEDSAYIKADRYKKKLVELCSALSELSQDRSLKSKIFKRKITKKDISDEMTGIQSIDQAILDFVNAGVTKANQLKHITNPNAIPDCITMPDYLDVLKIIKNKNEESDLKLSNRKMEKLAQTAFKAVGKYLKKQRQRETDEFLSSCADTNVQDPALKDSELNLKLKENKCKGEQKLNEVFKFYENKQDGLSPKELEKEKKPDSEIDSESEDDDSNKLNQDNENEDQIKSNAMKKKEEKKTEKNKMEKSKLDLVNVNKKVTQEYFSESEQEEKEQNKAKITADTPEKSDVVENLSSSNVKATQNTKNKNDVFKRISIDSEDIVLEYNSTSEDDPLKIDSTSGTNEHSSSTKNKAAQQTNSIREKVLISPNFGKCKVVTKNNQNEILTNLKINSSLNEEVVTELKKSINNSISKLDNNVATKNCTTLNSNVNAANKESEIVAEIEHRKSKTDTGSPNSPDKEKRTNIVYPLQQTKQNSCSNDNFEKTKNFNVKKGVATVIKAYEETIDDDVCLEIDEDVSLKSADVTLKKDTSLLSCDRTDKTSESSFIKVKSFAKPPESWKDSQSPTKKTPNQLTTECIVDLTDDEDPLPIVNAKSYANNKTSTNNTIINPVAVNNLRPVHNVVVVKNFINNYNVPVKNKGSSLELKSPRDAQQQGGKFNIVKNTNVIINKFPPSSSNVSPRQHPANLVRKPYSSSSQRKDSK